MTKFPNSFKKPYFWLLFCILKAKLFFSKKLALSHTLPYELLTPCWVPGKTNEAILKKFDSEGHIKTIQTIIPTTARVPMKEKVIESNCCR